MTRVTTVLICMCERCGYGGPDHPKTVRTPWVAKARPQQCEGCGSPQWDVPRKSGPQIAIPVESRLGCIGHPWGFRRMLGRLPIKLSTPGAAHSTPSRRSSLYLAEKPIPRDRTFAEPRFQTLIEHLQVRARAIVAKSALSVWIRIHSIQRFS